MIKSARVVDGPHATPTKTSSGPIYLNVGDLEDGRVLRKDLDHLSEEDYYLWTRRVTPQPRDLVFSYETRIGQAAIIPEGLRCCLGRRMGLLRPNQEKALPEYLIQAYLGPELQEVIRKNTIFGSTVDRILLTEMPEYEIHLPPLVEQRKIAAILGAWDEAIAAAERLVAALRERKRGLMQRLLTGRVRFQEFVQTQQDKESRAFGFLPADWREAKLGEFVQQRREWIILDDNQEYKRCTVKLRNLGVFTRDKVPGTKVATKKQQLTRENDLIVAEIDAKVGGFGIVKGETAGSIVSSHFFLFEVLPDVEIGFLEQCIYFGMLEKQVAATGSTNYAAVRPRDVLSYVIPLPKIEEQRRISKVLALCVCELRQQEQHLALLRQQKRGLMQRLLTGQVRVAVDEEQPA